MSAPSILRRFRTLDRSAACDLVRIEHGTLDDYAALAAFHYRSGNPGIVTSVLRAIIEQPSSAPQLAGVLVRARPRLACRMRDDALGERYRGLNVSEAAQMVNREIRTISRVIIDPRFRGCGIAVRLVRHALDHPEPANPPLRYTEALAAMGRVCPFFEKAGMQRYDRPLRSDQLRMLDALAALGIDSRTLASRDLTRERLGNLDSAKHPWITREIARWLRHAQRGKQSARGIDLHDESVLHQLQRALTSQPSYYIFHHEISS